MMKKSRMWNVLIGGKRCWPPTLTRRKKKMRSSWSLTQTTSFNMMGTTSMSWRRGWYPHYWWCWWGGGVPTSNAVNNWSLPHFPKEVGKNAQLVDDMVRSTKLPPHTDTKDLLVWMSPEEVQEAICIRLLARFHKLPLKKKLVGFGAFTMECLSLVGEGTGALEKA